MQQSLKAEMDLNVFQLMHVSTKELLKQLQNILCVRGGACYSGYDVGVSLLLPHRGSMD